MIPWKSVLRYKNIRHVARFHYERAENYPELRLEFKRCQQARDPRIDKIYHLPTKESAQALGEALRKRRSANGCTLRKLSDETRITIHNLQAIEDGNLAHLPGGLYLRSFIRIYARAIGFDEAVALQIFNSPAPSEPTQALIEEQIQKRPQFTAVERQHTPPRFAEYLLYLFLSKDERINLFGDLEEEYASVVKKFGKVKAKIWFYCQVGSSLKPLVWRWITKLRTLVWLVEFLGRLKS